MIEWNIVIVLGLLVVAIVLFAFEVFSVDVITLIMLLVLVATGILVVLLSAATAIGGVLRLRWLTQELTDDTETTLRNMLQVRDAKSRFLSVALVLFVLGFACYCVAIALMLVSVTPTR